MFFKEKERNERCRTERTAIFIDCGRAKEVTKNSRRINVVKKIVKTSGILAPWRFIFKLVLVHIISSTTLHAIDILGEFDILVQIWIHHSEQI